MAQPEIVVPLTVRDLRVEDLATLTEEPATKLESMVGELRRAELGEVDYLALCPPSDVPVAYGAVDYAKPSGIATLNQLSVLGSLRSCGLGTILVQALEERIRDRGLRWAELGVDDAEPRPRALYERLGYAVSGSEHAAWNVEAADGSVTRYETTVTLLRKDLS